MLGRPRFATLGGMRVQRRVMPPIAANPPADPAPRSSPAPRAASPMPGSPPAVRPRLAQGEAWSWAVAAAGRWLGKGALLGAAGLALVGCSTLEIELPPDQAVGSTWVRAPHLELNAGPTNARRWQRFLDAQTESLPDAVQAMLEAGLRQPVSSSSRGASGLLRVESALRASRAFSALRPNEQASMLRMLERSGREAEDPRLVQAALLGALGAGRSLDALAAFEVELRGVSRSALVERLVPIDVDDRNTRLLDPSDLLGPPSAYGDDDGLYQRYTESCVPTVAQMVAGLRDPMTAWALGADPVNADPDAGGGAEQARVLTATGTAARSRLGISAAGRSPVRALDDAIEGLAATHAEAIVGFVTRTATVPEADLEAALAEVDRLGRALHREELEAMRALYVPPTVGMSVLEGMEAVLGAGSVEAEIPWGTRSAFEMQQLLEQGRPVPFVVQSEAGGHMMLASDVRRDGGRSYFLVSDPWEGRTAWVGQPDFESGRFLRTTFRIGHEYVAGYYRLAE